MFRRAFLALVAFGALGAEPIRVQWDANSEPDLAGYRLRGGGAPGAVEWVIDVGLTNLVSVTITNRTFLTVTAYNTAGLESGPSNEIEVGSTNLASVAGYRVVEIQFVP
jgi:hypothetical protein